ncbi:Co/Ni ABC transporter CbiKLMQO, ATP-binding protein CbiO [Campylobacter iguaniorum]|uniref:energy-coupling factor ABC transporter ATP-binding protein n=1 Tax=Campylobacter iguaniorum TaxID=1244531 RepID=UPI0007C8F972|nr:ABC transporter ATP-binding protein [Campylobacter iguaniorum]ANE35233.1 Co/Ni ABC transporter CbiKLMQO, ATP-binding protein CbiO [Campylobacter iguaniorum]
MSCSITLKDISAKNAGKLLFENISLNAGHKDKIAIIGNNGVGKTTLLEIMAGLRQPSSGEVEIFHNKILNLNDFANYRKDIGYLFQNSNDQFIAPSVFDDVSFSLLAGGMEPNLAYEKTRELLKELGIYHLKDKIVFHLSGGEKKLVALAGVLVNKPKILLLDEPTTALDFAVQSRVSDLLLSLDMTQIIVSHDKEFINKVANKMFYLEQNGLKQIG